MPWYFTLSREQVLIFAADTPADTGTRLFSMVRLVGVKVEPCDYCTAPTTNFIATIQQRLRGG